MRFALQCSVFCFKKCARSASFNNEAMVSGDELVRMIALNSEGGIIVVIDECLLDGQPTQFVLVCIIAHRQRARMELTVRLPAMLCQDLGVLT